ncbi:UDP-N-acetylmuramoyl-tripeptide--D-alanyl-D-alanine ligase [Ectobacillus sp. JY-23]|uniref:UDP-N-acetylmuramoyl-tripeptide--D-alanyl-D- alanine ligase n=1 Tax=Ectobacillus sp. JY-23 TaxID=2933872 RepID=UPI001FF274E5|nr:UDP-N-acetylmuramoyl-tripeptide--D-alanyl-D-alanine ligase [Ectobacillus sp. JY-23]UOY91553.1 UDP-N-acetylmuramoyl-tripeptide--D-alanyl-D-alanine ligase [Ectobacillus sp. JY-23]
MIKRTLAQVQQMVGGDGLEARYNEVSIQGVSIDSRRIEQGNLYIPIQGERFDGHTFTAGAVDNGAAAVLWQKDVKSPPANVPVIYVDDTLAALQKLSQSYRNELDVKVIGITGSNGKTSAKDILTGLLATTFKVQKTEGNYNNHIGMPLTILRLEEDTEMAVLEMGMSGFGEISFLSNLARPDAAIITNIGESHLMELGSRDGIAQAKLEITEGLQGGIFVYNGDEPLLTNRVSTMSINGKLVTFGESHTNDYYPLQIEMKADGTSFRMNRTDETFFLKALGKHNVYNALACMAVAAFFGVPWDRMQQGLAKLQLTGMRMEVTKKEDGLTIINDAYNASPTSMRAALAFCKELSGYRNKVLVLGDMLELGDQEEQFHYEVGQEIDLQTADFVFTYGILGAQIARGAIENIGKERVKQYDDKRKLAESLKQVLTGDDVVLLKASRGMKLEEVLNYL